MRRLISRFTGRFSAGLRGVAAITLGTAFGQLILVAVAPILSRLYTPEHFGILSLLMAVAAILGPTATLKLEAALLLPKDEDTARRLLRLALFSSTAVAVASGVTVWLLPAIGFLTELKEVEAAPLWVSGMVLASSTFSVLSQAALRDRQYKTVANRSITQAIGMAFGQVGLGLIHPSSASLMGGYLFGRSVGYVPLIRASRSLFKRPLGGGYRRTLRHYWRFPLVFTPSGLLNSLGSQLPILLIALWFAAEGAGQLGMAQRLVFVPMTLIGASLAQVFGAEISRRLRDGAGGMSQLYLRISSRVGMLAAALALAIFLLAPSLLPFILGPTWEGSGLLAQAMALSVGLGLVVSPLSRVYMTFQRSFASITVDISRIALLVSAAVVSRLLDADIVTTAWLLYGGQAVNYIVTWAWGYRIVQVAEREAQRGSA
ncbi:oligosaccharide flippase family protein [Salinibacterium sp. SYSU T00001]|uniref:oligosaccharide flippase family protein n=1 Tax=Homoserinimonas sedimenticola TaxID=2986805 RepID=UPI002235DE65|nr:oligosaccharide flippase family protein [Salinibacterium sedimenticola]MCW4385037.1 oligosaccharide flippase family protein [Salinibacterium sedimenticola]